MNGSKDFSKIDDWTPGLIALLKSGNEDKQECKSDYQVSKGERNTYLASILGYIIAKEKSIPFDDLLRKSRIINATFSPPLLDDEVIRTTKSIHNRRADKDEMPEMPVRISGDKLMTQTYPLPRWAIPGILHEGLNLVVGKPKKGKSLMALNFMRDIGLGGKVFDLIPVEKGAVIYLALEDTERRLKDRLLKMAPNCDSSLLKGLHFYTKFPHIGAGGIDLLRKVISDTQDVRLVIIDTLQRFRGPAKSNSYSYSADYDDLATIKCLADELSVSILIVHHQRKSESDDVYDTVSGTLGISGAVDGIIILEQQKNTSMCALHITGRDVESAKMQVRLDADTLSWKSVKAQREVATEGQEAVFNAVINAQEEISVKRIMEVTGFDKDYVGTTLRRLENKGLIEKASRGKYRYVKPIEQAPLPFLEGVS